MRRERYDVSTLEQFVGQELGVSDWLTVDQERINEFADCTGDHQWIHVDGERAQRESPRGSTIAHGYLTLALLPAMNGTQYRTGGCFSGPQLRPRPRALYRAGESGSTYPHAGGVAGRGTAGQGAPDAHTPEYGRD